MPGVFQLTYELLMLLTQFGSFIALHRYQIENLSNLTRSISQAVQALFLVCIYSTKILFILNTLIDLCSSLHFKCRLQRKLRSWRLQSLNQFRFKLRILRIYFGNYN